MAKKTVAKQAPTKPVRGRSGKLTAKQVLAIRAKTGTLAEDAAKYGVSKGMISKIRAGKVYQSVA